MLFLKRQSSPAPAPTLHDHDLSPDGLKCIIVSCVFSAVATVFVGLRFWVRKLKRTSLLLEDWMLLVALILLWTWVIVVFFLAYDGGLGWPNTQVTPAALVREVKIGLAGQTNWPIAVGLIKVSICLTFIRIFFTRKFRIYATVVYGLCIAWTVATVLVGYTICIPLSAQWDLTSTGNCGNETAAYVSLGVLDAATDIAVFLLPLPMLYTLQVPMHTKIALISTFGLGIFTIASSILRLVSVIQIDFNQDFEQGQVNDVLWCSIECSVGLIVASSLVMRPLLDRGIHLLSRITGSSRGSSTMRGSESSGSGSAGLGMGNIVDIRASTSKASRDGTLVGDCSDEYERILKTTQSGFTEEGTKGHDFRDDNVV